MAKILLITNIFSPEIGGPAQFIEQFAAYLDERGYTITVICNTTASRQHDHKMTYRVIRPYQKTNKLINFIKLRFFLLFEIVRHKKIFVVGLQNEVYKYASFLKRSYAVKVVSDPVWEKARNTGKTLLDVLDFQTDKDALKSFKTEKELWSRSMNYARTIIAPGDYVRKLIISWVTQPEKIVVIKNSADLRVFENHLPLKRNKDQFLKIIFIGRLSNLKGLETLLLAVKDIENIQVSICGNGPEYVQLHELSRQLQNKHVHFLGALTKKQILEILKEHHVLVLPSITEGLSHTLIDAISAGVPCIASSVGGNPEVIIHNYNGLLFPARDVGALKNALIYMRDREADRFTMAVNAKKSAEQFDQQKTFPIIEEQILKI